MHTSRSRALIGLLCGLFFALLLFALLPGVSAQAQVPAPGGDALTAAQWAAKGDTALQSLDGISGMDDYRQAVSLDPARLDYVLKLAGIYALAAGLRDSATREAIGAMLKGVRAPDEAQLPDPAVALQELLEHGLTLFPAPTDQKRLNVMLGGAAKILPQEGDDAVDHSDYGKAADDYGRSLAIVRRLKSVNPLPSDAETEATALNGLGNVYDELGQHRRAAALFMEEWAVQRKANASQPSQAGTLNNLGWAYDGAGESRTAITYYEQALTIERTLSDDPLAVMLNGISGSGLQAYTLGNLGLSYYRLGQPTRGIEYGERALALMRKTANRHGEGSVLSWLGWGYGHQGQTDKALPVLAQSLAVNHEIGNQASEAFTCSTLMFTWKALNQPRLAIWYGKEAVNGYQAVRAHSQRLEKDLQKSLLQSHEDTYRQLADLLLSQGRLPEAEQVLDLLKEEEFFDFLQRDAKEAVIGRTHLTPEEAALEKHYTEIADQVTAIGAERGTLLAKASRTPEENKRLDTLEKDLEAANAHFGTFLAGLQTTLGSQAAGKAVTELGDAEGLQSILRTMGGGAVALYTLVTADKYAVLLVTPDAQKVEQCAVPKEQLDRKITAFREALRNPAVDPRPLAQELYAILFCQGKLAHDLDGAGAKTLMWSLDGSLAYLPMSALYDGKQYLVERYRNVVFTPVSKANLTLPVSPTWKALGLGVSKPHQVGGEAGEPSANFPALPGAAAELHEITGSGGEMPGTIQMDDAFTKEALRLALRERYPLVHIASHFQFLPGDDTRSFLLLGDGSTLSAAAMKRMPGGFEGVELLTLSACNTAMGGVGADGTEVEGFAALVQRKGAEAVLASLWSVSDASTSLLMQQFYRRREAGPGTSKADALQQAQLALLRGTLSASVNAPQRSTKAPAGEGERSNLSLFVADPKAPYAHPFYWAPFILIGNWK